MRSPVNGSAFAVACLVLTVTAAGPAFAQSAERNRLSAPGDAAPPGQLVPPWLVPPNDPGDTRPLPFRSGVPATRGTVAPYLYSLPSAMNDRGQVVGESFNEDLDPTRATFWDRGVPVDLGIPPGRGFAYGLNNAGQVVGAMEMPDGVRHAFVWKRGVLKDLGAGGPGSLGAGAIAINSKGWIVGAWLAPPAPPSQDPSSRAFLWRNGKYLDLGELYGPILINDRGQVMWVDNSHHTLFWDHGVTVDLGLLDAGSPGTLGADLNNRGQVVGFAYPGSGGNRAFFWQRGRLSDLGAGHAQFPTASSSAAVAINARGDVVGYSSEPAPDYTPHALLWEPCGPPARGGAAHGRGCEASGFRTVDLDAHYAIDINDRGEILAQDAVGNCVMDRGVRTYLDPPDASWMRMNDTGDVLGYRYVTIPGSPAGYYPVGLLWRDGEAIDLPGVDAVPAMREVGAGEN